VASGFSRTSAQPTAGNLSSPISQCRSEVDDAGLLDAARGGDAEAFSRLFARFQGPIYRYAAHMCGRERGDDVVQETFLAVLRDPVRFDPSRGTLGAYLFGIARHQVFSQLRVRTGEPLDDIEARTIDEAPQSTVLEYLTRSETIAAVRDAIATLPAVYREVVVLCELQEMSYVDAAAVVQCPIGTVRSRLHRAKGLLTAKLAALSPEPAGK
jgi:RNA polymerase sigma-70 factor (ECF subfamily)